MAALARPLVPSEQSISLIREPFVNHPKSKNPWIAGLCSFVLHLMLLLIMAIWTIAGIGVGTSLSLVADLSPGQVEELDTFALESPLEGDPNQPLTDAAELTTSIPVVESQPTLDPVLDRDIVNPDILSHVVRQSSEGGKSGVSAFVNSSIEGRSSKNRAANGERNGSTPASEAAVEAALAYLAKHQRNNGSWTVRFEEGPCLGECDHGGPERDPHEIAATGLALLCFMGAGHTMHAGEYSEQVSRGIYFLIQNLKIHSGRGTWLTEVAKSEMYEHGIATLAICEALQMTGDTSLKESCQAAINHIVYAQHTDGGWDYHPKSPGDLSIVGWQVLALKSAASAKLSVNAETIRGIDLFLRQHSRNDFMFFYRDRSNKPTASMTAIGTLMRIFRGWSNTDPSILKAVDFLAKEGPSNKDVYYNYYATQVLFQFGGKPWGNWNAMMREYLIHTQEREGHMAGSWWFPGDMSNRTGGRLYVTAMACLTLEVYYRYMPVYNTPTDDFQF